MDLVPTSQHQLHPPRPTTLNNAYVSLRPLEPNQAAAYFDIGQDEEIWTYLTPAPFRELDDASRWIDGMLERAVASGDVPFSIYDNVSGALAGSSSYLDVRLAHAGLEIGFTWYGKAFRRTHVNTASKLALLEHAFEVLGANRVQLQTDRRNEASQAAIARIGATQEGILRRHKVYPDGYVRDSVMFSITVDEWPQVKAQLVARLDR